MSKTFELYGEQIRQLTEEGKSSREIGEIIGAGSSTVHAIVQKHGFQKALLQPTEEQWEVLIGTLIGDGCLFKASPNSLHRMNLAHSLKQETYFHYKYEMLKSLIRTEPKKRSWIEKRNGTEYHEIRFQTRVNPLFSELYEKWYRDGKKIIDYENIKDCGALCLAIKYFDDGHLTKAGQPTISMNDYDVESSKNLQRWLSEKFGVDSAYHKPGVIYIPARSKAKFLSLVEPYATSDLLYKIQGPV